MTAAHEIPLAVREEGPVIWDVARLAQRNEMFWISHMFGDMEAPTTDPGTPHCLAVGEGPDMRRVRRRVIDHALQHASSWEVVALDAEGGEFGYLGTFPNVRVATGLEKIVAALREVETEMEGAISLCKRRASGISKK